MKKIAILTDSGSGMSKEEALQEGIFLLPLQVIDGENTYQDGVDMSTFQLYALLKQQHTPKTSLPILSVIQETIADMQKQGYEEIIAFPLSSGLSSTFNSIQMCADQAHMPLTIIENYTTCDLQKYGALLGKKLVDEEKSVEEVKTIIGDKVAHSGTLILPNDLQHLKRGGRLTPIAAAAASLLKIKPILKIDPSTNGKIDVFDKVRTERKATSAAIDYISDQMHGKEGFVYVIHSDNMEKAEMIKLELVKRNPQLSVHINYISAVISAHTGLDCIAIQYIEK